MQTVVFRRGGRGSFHPFLFLAECSAAEYGLIFPSGRDGGAASVVLDGIQNLVEAREAKALLLLGLPRVYSE